MISYRLAHKKHKSDLSGFGAFKFGGRWNSKGTSLLYTAENRALCLAEIIVHFDLGNCPENYILLEIWFPDLCSHLPSSSLPNQWNSFPHPGITKAIGDKFVKRRQQLALRVPSSVVPGDFNYLINPLHSEFNKVRIVSTVTFPFDKRLFS
ncbi:MAG: RES family NAD+ phosphorylase [Saprospiraceae bacterium]